MVDSPFSKQPENLYKHSDLPLDETDEQSGRASGSRKRLASVLLPLHRINNDWHLLFIRRAENRNDRHSGQVAFPGGAEESIDTNQIETALRETEEEIGIAREDVEIIATLPIYTTSSYFQVTPVVGILKWPLTITPAPDEVARVFSIPLSWLKNYENFELRSRSGNTSKQHKPHPVVYFNRFDGELLWGASARMTLNLLRALDEDEIRLPD